MLINFGWQDGIYGVRCRSCYLFETFPQFEVGFQGYQDLRRHMSKLGWIERSDNNTFECPTCCTTGVGDMTQEITALRTKLFNLENEIDRLSKEAEGAYAVLVEEVATALDYDPEFLELPEDRECEDSPTGWCVFDKDRKKYPECLACGRI